MRSLLLQNLKLTIPTTLIFTILGYILSLPLSFLVNPQAARWQFHLQGQGLVAIETRKLDELGSFQAHQAWRHGIGNPFSSNNFYYVCN